MVSTIESVCGEIHNFFETSKEIGDYTIDGGGLSLPFLSVGQFFRIIGSKFNDGVYIYSDEYLIRDASWDDILNDYPNWMSVADKEWGELKHTELIDESFHGAICPMAIPRAFLELTKEIDEYIGSDASKASPYVSENIGGHYSYTKAKPSDNAWQNVFSAKLKRWRKVPNI